MVRLTQKQIGILKVLAGNRPVLSHWNNRDLTVLESAKLATSEAATLPSGRLHSSKIWRISDAGRRFLETERAGQ